MVRGRIPGLIDAWEGMAVVSLGKGCLALSMNMDYHSRVGWQGIYVVDLKSIGYGEEMYF